MGLMMFIGSFIPNIDSSFIHGYIAPKNIGNDYVFDLIFSILIFGLAFISSNTINNGILLLLAILTILVPLYRYDLLTSPTLPFMHRTDIDKQCQTVDVTMLVLQFILIVIFTCILLARRSIPSPIHTVLLISLFIVIGYQYFTYYKHVLVAEVEQCKERFAPNITNNTIPIFDTTNLFTNISTILKGPLFQYIINYSKQNISGS
jgi:hypothetical protein